MRVDGYSFSIQLFGCQQSVVKMSRTIDSSLVTEKWLIVKLEEGAFELIEDDLIRPYNNPDLFRAGQRLTIRSRDSNSTRQAILISGSNNYEEQIMQLEVMRWVQSQQIELLQVQFQQPSPSHTHAHTVPLEQNKRHTPQSNGKGQVSKIQTLNKNQPCAEEISSESEARNKLNESPQPGPSNTTNTTIVAMDEQEGSDYDNDAVIPHVRKNYGIVKHNILISNTASSSKTAPAETVSDSIISVQSQVELQVQTQEPQAHLQRQSIETPNPKHDQKNSHQRHSNKDTFSCDINKKHKFKKSKFHPKEVSYKSAVRNSQNVSPEPGPSNIITTNTSSANDKHKDSNTVIPHIRRNYGMLHQNQGSPITYVEKSQLNKHNKHEERHSKKQHNNKNKKPNEEKISTEPEARNTFNMSSQPGCSQSRSINVPSGNTMTEPVDDQDNSNYDSDTVIPHIRKNYGIPSTNRQIAMQKSVKQTPSRDKSISQKKLKYQSSRHQKHSQELILSKRHKNKKKKKSPKSDTRNMSPQPGPSNIPNESNRSEAVDEQKSSDYDSDTVIPHIRQSYGMLHQGQVREMQTPVVQPQLEESMSLNNRLPKTNGHQSQSVKKSSEQTEPVPLKKRKLQVNSCQPHSQEQAKIPSSNGHKNNSNKKTESRSPQPGTSSSKNNNSRCDLVYDQELTNSEAESRDLHTTLTTSVLDKLMNNTALFNTQPSQSECSECVRNNALQLLFALKTKQKVEELSGILKRLAEISTEITSLQPQRSVAVRPYEHEREEIAESNSILNVPTQTEDIRSPSCSSVKNILQEASVGQENIMTSIDNEINRIRIILHLNTDTVPETDEKEEEPNRVQMIPIGNGNTQVPYDEYIAIDWNFYVHATRSLLLSVFPRSMIAASSLDSESINNIIITVATNSQIDPALVRNAIRTISAEEYEKRQKKIKRRAEWKRVFQKKSRQPRPRPELASKIHQTPSSDASSNTSDDVSSMS